MAFFGLKLLISNVGSMSRCFSWAVLFCLSRGSNFCKPHDFGLPVVTGPDIIDDDSRWATGIDDQIDNVHAE